MSRALAAVRLISGAALASVAIAAPALAQLPVVVEEAHVFATSAATNDLFGGAVALDGDTALVGASQATGYRGAAFVFVRSGNLWVLQQVLTAPTPTAGDYFGFSVALAGDTAVVGANGTTFGGIQSGVAYVFVRSGTTWSRQATLVAGDAGGGDAFGCSVALSGDTLLVGAYGDDGRDGATYAFVRTGAAWGQQAKLTAADRAPGDDFGLSCSLDLDTALIGARFDDDGGTNAGSAYVFTRSGTTWSQQAKLLAPDGLPNDAFGSAVALSGDTMLVGAPYDDGASLDAGSVYVLTRAGTAWTHQAHLIIADAPGGGAINFGYSVFLSGTTALVGAPQEPAGAYNGTAYLFSGSGSSWTRQVRIVSSDGSAFDNFGSAVSFSSGRLLVGAPDDDTAVGGVDAGSAYIFRLGQPDGAPCALDGECANRFCVDAVCCDTACGGGATNDCQACSIAAGTSSQGRCGILVSTVSAMTVCRAAAGACDLAETCTSASTVCPADARVAAGTVCRPASTPCDVAETCVASSPACPPDAVRPDGSSCSDGLVCNGAEVCSSSACASSGPLSCDDANLCTTDSCAEPSGCRHTTTVGCCNTATDCSDGNLCTVDVCSGPGGTCSHPVISGCCTTAAMCADASACTADSCNVATHTCAHTPITGCCAGAADCSDGNACTTDACSGGSCSNVAIAGCCLGSGDCDDGNACTTDSCSGVGGTCGHAAIAGCCNTSADCNDGIMCTVDSCNVATHTCAAVLDPGCCTLDVDCDDGRYCTIDSCVAGRCSRAPIPGCCAVDADCADGNPCTAESCNVAAHACVRMTVAGCCTSHSDCADSDPCTRDFCSAGTCANDPIAMCDAGIVEDAGATNDAGLADAFVGLDAAQPDAGSEAGPRGDGGAIDAASFDASATPDGSGTSRGPAGGCGCRASSPRLGSYSHLAVLFATLAVWTARRRRVH